MSRLPGYGRVDRAVTLSFTLDGRRHLGHPGDTLASALLADDVHRIATSVVFGRPRGIVSSGVDEASALVQLETPFPEPMLTATTVELFDGLVARGLPGRGSLADAPDPARYDAQHLHCDVLVVGAGPAGLQAALAAGRSGARVVLVDDQPEAGGSLLGTPVLPSWVDAAVQELSALTEAVVLSRTSAFGIYDDGFVLALQKRTDHLGFAAPEQDARHRVFRIRARQIVLATGAQEIPIVFADNDRPGIMLAHAAREYLHRYGVLAGQRVVVFTCNDSAYSTAVELAEAGAAVTVVDPRTELSRYWTERFSTHGVTARLGQVVIGSQGTERVTGASVTATHGGPPTALDCDLLLVSGGWSPTLHLFSQARGSLEYDAATGVFRPGVAPPGLQVAGSATGEHSLTAAVRGGADAALRALAELGLPVAQPELPATPDEIPPAPPVILRQTGPEPVGLDTRFVDLQRDATVSDILRATGAGLRSVEHVKRYTTIGTAHDQGKTSGLLAAAITAQALGTEIAGPTTFRPPYTSVSFAALAGRDRGALFDPVRVTALQGWHVEHGAVFEKVGQWLRPRHYPAPGEDLDAAVARETRAARTGVAMMDGSTLGKISVQGTDAGVFLDRIYTNLISNLEPGCVRYGVMCGLDGMILDDGTVLRVSDTEFLVTTTTGNAAVVLDWLEEFAQTEWPDLDVWLTSVTEQWVTIPVVGPLSRAVLGAVAPDLAVSNEAFGFMAARSATIAGVAARVCRISFSGELAYEVNVPAWYGRTVWQAIHDAGQPFGITPYGTEAMHVLRAEKGYPIIGQDTDGTVTPQDLGLDWVISKKKPEFVGRRSFSRAENLRPDRKHLVGLLPVVPGTEFVEGAQVLATADVSSPPVPMLGHVTSSYRSVALGTTFALALVRSGRDRIGERVWTWHDGDLVAATVTHPVLYDRAGARRDG